MFSGRKVHWGRGKGRDLGGVDWGVGKVVRYEGLGLGRGLRGKGPQVQDWNV